ncbi:restriction endonuclease subunit S [Dolichospermum heterosporum]|uniref:Restriction endonuclease subunit S n=1 Tax=Dolichospermum heterosporum TAC447 TaxID=747523 RepID=A0ABY5LSS8_9CYAN|nr:restriction endonuclease subunit S [Dolichospermum heterosporum]UUO13797.1 restriction endonuclease subunit S [Dolichospermum heterosporum TAC447]
MNATQLRSVDYWGDIPENWQFIPIKYGFNLIGSGTTPPTGQEEYFGGSVPWVTTSELRENFITSTTQTVSELAIAEFSALKIFPENTVLIAMYGATIGRVAILGIPACVNQAVCALAQPICFEPRYVSYTLQASRDYLLSLASGGGQPNLNAEKIKSHYIPCPSLSKQRAIANYLDHETAKIDTLISAKEHLLDLLTEKRQSLITNVITCGLNPDIPMRDSGVEWIGHIPKHWNIKRIKFLIHGIDTGFSPQCYNFPAQEGEWGVLKTGCVNGGIFNPQENKTLPPEIEIPLEIEVKKDDILMSRASGSTDLIGSVALVENQPNERLLLSDKIFRLRLNTEICDANFFVITMGSLIIRQQILQFVSGAEGLANNITQSDIRELLIPIPPIEEQIKIVSFIKEKISTIDTLSQVALKTINYLQERRTALITAAVTGQIKVAA